MFLYLSQIDAVIHGTTPISPDVIGRDPYEVAKEMGIFKTIDSKNQLTTADIVQRIIRNK